MRGVTTMDSVICAPIWTVEGLADPDALITPFVPGPGLEATALVWDAGQTLAMLTISERATATTAGRRRRRMTVRKRWAMVNLSSW